MTLAPRLALRYLFARKSHKVVNVISYISMAGVAIATMAIVVVLSVFNGFSDLARRHLAMIDPDAKVVPSAGKVMTAGDSLARVLEALPEVAAAMPVLQERALLVADDAQIPVIVKGIDPARAQQVLSMDSIIIDGIYSPCGLAADSIAGAQISVGVAVSTGLRPSAYTFADIYMPRRLGRINPANPAAAYRSMPVAVSGVFRVDQPEYDSEYILAPLGHVRALLEYDKDECTAIEVKAARGSGIPAMIKAVSQCLPEGFEVLDREQQQPDTYRMIAVEKWVTFLMLIFILLIASFNIISTLSLLAIEKRQNMATLRALGASRRTVTSVFIWLGWLITTEGAAAGTIAGLTLSLIQQHFGVIRLNADPSALTIDVYPVRVEWPDIAAVFAAVLITGLLIAQTARLFTRK